MFERKAALVLATLCVLLGCNKGKEGGVKSSGDPKADSLISIARNLISANKIDSAEKYLSEANHILSTELNKPPIIHEIRFLKDDEEIEKILLNLSEPEYQMLLKNSLSKKYFFIKDSLIEQEVNKKLYQKRLGRPKLTKARQIEQEKIAKEAARKLKQKQIELRKEFADKIQDSFLDQGLNFKVRISGKENDRLFLEYALANEVWAHHFKKGDLINQIIQMGFKRVDLTDGYDYHVYWKF